MDRLFFASDPCCGAEGKLIQDLQEDIAWRVDGKVLKTNRTGGSAKKNLIFDYCLSRLSDSEYRECRGRESTAFEDQALAPGWIATATGSNEVKHVLTAEDVLEKSTYYVLDASGNTMSVYERVVDETEESVAFW